jgi:putative transposase
LLNTRPLAAVGRCLGASFLASLETELTDHSSWRPRADAHVAVCDDIEAFYNPRRRHSALGQLSPADFERRYPSAQDPPDHLPVHRP